MRKQTRKPQTLRYRIFLVCIATLFWWMEVAALFLVITGFVTHHLGLALGSLFSFCFFGLNFAKMYGVLRRLSLRDERRSLRRQMLASVE